MSTINLFRSALNNNHETISVTKHITIREALPKLDFSNSIIAVNGFQVDENYILHDHDICTIRLFPANAGFSPFEVFLGVITLGGYTITDAIVSGITGKTILQHAMTLMSWLAPDMPDSPDTTLQNIPQLRGAKNQSNKSKPIPLVLGKHLFTPMYIGSPYTTIGGVDGEDQYYNALYLLGWGKLDVRDIRLGPVSGLAKNATGVTDGLLTYDKNDGFCDPSFADSNPQLELRQGAREVNLYPQKVVEEQLGIQLMNAENNPLEVIRFSAKNPQKIQVEITFNNGLVSYNNEGKKVDVSVGVSVQWRGDPTEAWKEFGRFGTQGGTSPTSYNAATRITTITRQKAKVMRFVAERTFTYSEVKDAVDRTLELRIVRETTQPTDTTRTIDTVYLSAIRTWCFDNDATKTNNNVMVPQVPMITKYRNQTARLGFRIKATENLQGTIDALNCILTSYARTWNGTKWNKTEVPTNNPASLALKVLQSPALGINAYSDTMLDLDDTFAEFYEWCADREYTCNGVLTAEKRVDDLLNIVLAAGRGMRILDGNRYAILIDKPRENPVMILNNQNVLEAKNQKSFEDLPDGFSIKFVNEKDGYQETEVFVMADGSSKPEATSKIENIEMPFVTDYRQVVKNGWYQLACRYLRPEIWNRKLSIDGYLIGIGDRVEVQDDTIVVGIGEGAVITGTVTDGNGKITEIKTDGQFDVTDITNKQFGIKIMQADGINDIAVRTLQVHIPEPGTYRNFAFDPPVLLPFTPQPGDLVAFGEYNKITTPALCFGKKDNGDGTFDVTLVPYQEGIYTTDSGAIPEYEANITKPQAPVQIQPDIPSKGEVIEIIEGMDFTGSAAVVYELRPSASVIKKTDAGAFIPDTISCSQVFIEGNSPPQIANKTLQYLTSDNNTPIDYTGPITVSDWDWIEFILIDTDADSTELDRERVPILNSGVLPTIYKLIPSVNIIKKDSDGTYEPPTVSCAQQATTGTGEPAASSVTLVYLTSLNSTEISYTGPVEIETGCMWIEFRLYRDSILVDRDRIVVLDNGSASIEYLYLDKDNIVIPCDYDGFPSIDISTIINKASMYVGNTLVDTMIVSYSIENAPVGVSIDGNGNISIDKNTIFEDFNELNVIGTFQGNNYSSPFTIIKSRSGENTITLDLDNEGIQIPCLFNGTPKQGQLPLQVKATLYRGTDEITELLEYRFLSGKEIRDYPASGGGSLGDPMGAPDFPVPSAVVWSIAGNPAGIRITLDGLIIVDTIYNLQNNYTIEAVYRGKTYTKTLKLVKVLDGIAGEKGGPGPQGDPSPRYLGKTMTAPSTSNVVIQQTATQTVTVAAHVGDWVAYVGTNNGAWLNGYCYKWNGTQWTRIPVSADGNFETNPYIHALMDLTERSPQGAFMSILVRDLVAKTAMIEQLMTKVLTLASGGMIQSENFVGGSTGFRIKADGNVEFNNGTFRGELAARQVKVTGTVSSGTGYLLNVNNTLVAFHPRSGWIPSDYEAVAKEIRTLAKGSCLIRLRFPEVLDGSGAERNDGSYKLTVNDVIIRNWSSYATNVNIDIPNVALNNNVNSIKLYGTMSGSGNYIDFSFYNSIFELRCSQDPGFLAMLG